MNIKNEELIIIVEQKVVGKEGIRHAVLDGQGSARIYSNRRVSLCLPRKNYSSKARKKCREKSSTL